VDSGKKTGGLVPDALWLEFIQSGACTNNTQAKHFVDGIIPNDIFTRDVLMKHSYKSYRPVLKKLMLPDSYQKFIRAFKNFKQHTSKDFTTLKIDKRALRQLKKVRTNLGLDNEDDSYSAAIDWLSAPDVRREDDTNQALFDACNDNEYIEFGDEPDKFFYQQLECFMQRLPFKDQEFLGRLVEQSLINGWRAKAQTKGNKIEKLKAAVDEDHLYSLFPKR